MRVLVAEEDLIISTRLQRILRGFGHEVEAVRDGITAWKLLEKNDAPRAAILDGILPGKGGLEIATELRSRNQQHYVYIITLAPNRESCEAVAAFEAGADGHLALPVTPAELAAQLRVAERVLAREEGFHRQIAELRQQLHAPQVPVPQLAPVVAADKVADSSTPSDEPHIAEAASRDTGEPGGVEVVPQAAEITCLPALRLETVVPVSRMQACFETMLRRIRYVPPAPVVPAEPMELTVCSAVVLEDQHLWADLKMEVTRRVAGALYRALMGEALASDTDQQDALEEVCNLCQGAWKTVLESAGLQPITPGAPSARPTRDVPLSPAGQQLGSFSFFLPGPIRVSVIEQLARVTDKPLGRICVGDVLADPFSIPGQKLPLLRRGTVLNPRYIARIGELLNGAPDEAPTLHVIEPSPLARILRRRWPRHSLDTPLVVIVGNGATDRRLFGQMRDISENGVGATLDGTLNLEQTVTLGFSLDGQAVFEVEATVRHRQGCHYGFEFLSAANRSTDKLKQAIRALTGC
jgi:CheY-like chemotaxis protein